MEGGVGRGTEIRGAGNEKKGRTASREDDELEEERLRNEGSSRKKRDNYRGISGICVGVDRDREAVGLLYSISDCVSSFSLCTDDLKV